MRNLSAKMLSEDGVELLSARLRQALPPKLVEFSDGRGLGIEDTIRFAAVAARSREARETREMDLKGAAKALRVPQYRLRAIEEGRLTEVKGAVLDAYMDFLELKKWFARWRRVNPELAARLAPDAKSKEE